MPTSQDQGFFAEQNDFSLILARTAKGRGPVIEELIEAPLVEKSAVEEAIKAVFPAGVNPLTAVAIRPVEDLHLATADEGKRHTTPTAVQKFGKDSVELAPFIPGFFAVAAARDGAGAPWLLAATTTAAHAQNLAVLGELQLKAGTSSSASLHAITALISTLKARNSDAVVLCLDLGALTSHALIATRRGIEAAGTAPISLDAISEAVQLELGLKFKGSAGKLFFNELYDFSETGPKIAGRLAEGIKASLAQLGGSAPTELYCAGLPAKQQWLATHLAPALGLTLYAPDVKAWCTSSGITFANPTLEGALSPAWIGFLHFVHLQSSPIPATIPPAWSSEWISFDAALAPAPVAAPAIVAPPPPAPAPKPAAVVTPPPAAKPAAVVTPPPPAPKPAAVVTPPKPTPLPAKPAPAAAVSYPPKPAAAPAKPPTPTPPAKPTPTPTPPPKAAPAPAPKPAPVHVPVAVAEKPAKKGGMGMIIAIVVVVLALGGGGYLYMQSQKAAEEKRIADKAIEDKRIRDEAEKARLVAEQKAKDEQAAALKKQQDEMNAKLAAAEAARQQAEKEAQAQAAARLANARGTVTITTEPVGAMVTLGTMTPKPSPATFADVKIGKYPLTISQQGHESVNTEVEVKENATTELPLVKLVKILGAIEVASEPAGVSFEFHPAGMMMVPADAHHTGQTPAKVDNLATGDYSVTFTREGWAPHTETVTVARDATARVSYTFPNGVVKINSDPVGATIIRSGAKIGVTPLTLPDQIPGDVRYELSLAGYEQSTLIGRVESGKVLSLSTPLLSVDRIASMAELDERPKPLSPVQPEIPPELAQKGGRVEIQLTVTKTGTTKDLVVLSSPTPELGKLCLEAAAKWKFSPGKIKGKVMNSRVVVPFLIGGQ